jgi:isfu1 transposase
MYSKNNREFTMKAYSQDLRDRVIELYKTKEYTKTALTKIFKLSYQTVFDWINRYNESGNCSSKQHIQSGRKPRFTDKESVLSFLSTNPDSEGIDIRNAVAPELPMSTFYDSLSRMKITYKKKSRNTREGARLQEESL